MRKRLGQYFLKNREVAKKIVAALELRSEEVIVEIGAGHGELTQELRTKNKELRILAIEKDPQLVVILKNKFSEDGEIKIIEGDALKVLESKTYHSSSLRFSEPNGLKPKTWKLVGNIPYYITGRLLRTLGDLEKKPTLTVLTIQKEVAERVVSQPPRMNRLSAIVQSWAKPEIVAYLPRGNFSPSPKVDSAIIKLETKTEKDGIGIKGEVYDQAVGVLFKQPRKTILNNLAWGVKQTREILAAKLKKIGLNPDLRPQNLEINQIIAIAREIF